jgi:uncharacterized protein with HEPN domain
MKDDRLYLVDMLEIARRVEHRMAKLDRAGFDSNEDAQLAMTHLLQMIGEAARCVSETSRQQFPSIDWRLITGMRHRIVHDYTNVNVAIVWETAKDDIPALIAQLAPVVDPIIAEAKREKGSPKQ